MSLNGKKSRPSPEVVCGTEDVAGHAPELSALQGSVARLLFTSGSSQYLCTGWLVAGSNSDTLMTNDHCFSTQNETSTLQAMFNFQRTTCGGTTNATTTT